MNAGDRELAQKLKTELKSYSTLVRPLPGIESEAALETFVFQIIESIRRVRFVLQIADRKISPLRADPNSSLFDPVRAAILMKNANDLDEAGWLVFLFTHFGKNLKSGYRLVRDVYGRLGDKTPWSWQQVSNDTFDFRKWLDKNQGALKTSNGVHRGFGNHRKYQSLSAWKANGTGAAVESYVKWVKNAGGHQKLFHTALQSSNGDGRAAFRDVYRQMNAVASFGRTAKFDYLTMAAKVGIAQIEADSVYFSGATGPIDGAKLLFLGNETASKSTSWLQEASDALADALGIGMQAMEDSLCNWQKSPITPVRFRG
jgi:hypothetical protein